MWQHHQHFHNSYNQVLQGALITITDKSFQGFHGCSQMLKYIYDLSLKL